MATRFKDRPRSGRLVPPGRAPDLRPLLGEWVGYDERSTGISRIVIGDRGAALSIGVFGADRPEPRYWGEVAGAAFSSGVDTAEAVGFRANYRFDFATVLLAGYLNQRLLVVDAYSVFTDSSGRSGYFQRDHFYLPRT
ncbi:hypothetical protein [Amycolatopsis anabasis]|uniref:hypothetical protein n=1 Tax=Amycolatopsis anabasis TaxID=1840409 RepID=UPI00131BA8AE|nr:hypothetical protein [Amycolatopsis anabasis]